MPDAPVASTSTSSSLRPSLLLFALAFATLLASGVLNLFASSARERHLTTLSEGGRPPAALAATSAFLARDDLRLRYANLFLLALAGVLATFAVRLEFKRPSSPSDWITICAWTRRVLWNGRWVSFEEFLAQRYAIRCTHGICDEAADKLRRG